MPVSPEEMVLGIRRNPVGWIKDTFGDDLIGKQNELIEAVADPNIREIYAPSCHDSGKTFTSSRALFQWLAAYPNDSIVVSTAPTWSQVENLLWKEVAAGYAKSKVPFGGELLGTQLKLGRSGTPSDSAPTTRSTSRASTPPTSSSSSTRRTASRRTSGPPSMVC